MIGSEIVGEIIKTASEEAGGALAAAAGAGVMMMFHRIKRYFKERDRRKHSVQFINAMDLEVYKVMAELLAVSNADRINVFQFHNGTFFINTNSQMKFSCTHELVKPGFSKEMMNTKDIPLSTMPTTINRVINSESIIIDIDQIDEDMVKSTMDARGTKLSVVAVIKSKDVIDGFISIDFINNDILDEQEQLSLKDLTHRTASRVGHILRTMKHDND
jgi:hypothetical protein